MSMTVLCVGRMKEKPYRQMADEYRKRLSRYGKFEEIEVPDLAEPAHSSEALEAAVRKKEGEQLLARIRPGDYVLPLGKRAAALCTTVPLFRAGRLLRPNRPAG